MNETLPYIATTLAGLEDILETELRALGATQTIKIKRAVAFDGSPDLVYLTNLWCRTALQVLVNLKSDEINSAQDLYDCAYSVAWEDYFRPSDTFMINAVVNDNHFINNSLFASLKTKDAVVDRLRDKFGSRPSVDTENPSIIINVHISRNIYSISLNSTGLPLFKRGYKTMAVQSPLNEVLAAGIISLSKWDMKAPLFDPFCGSGTIIIEAAMMAANLAPGLYRNNFCFFNWVDFNRGKWRAFVDEAKSKMTFEMPEIFGADISARAISIAERNIENAGFSDFITLKKAAFGNFIPFTTRLETSGSDGDGLETSGSSDDGDGRDTRGFIITNPPYGIRTDDTNILELYDKIGSTFKHQLKGCSCWVICSDNEAINKIGLHASSKFKLFNGSLECKLMGYKMY